MPKTYYDMVEWKECEEWFPVKYMGLTKAPTEDELCFCNKVFFKVAWLSQQLTASDFGANAG